MTSSSSQEEAPSPIVETRSQSSNQTTRRRSALLTFGGSSAVTLIVAAQAIVLAPIFLREIGPSLYGAWLATGEMLIWIQAFDLGLPNLLIQRIGSAHARGDSESVGQYAATGLAVLSLVALVIAAAAVLSAPLIPQFMELSRDDADTLASTLAVAGTATAFGLVTNGAIGFARGVQQTGLMSAASLVSTVAGFAASLVLLLGGWGLWAAAWGIVLRSGLLISGAALFVVIQLRRGLAPSFRINRRTAAEMLFVSPATALGGLAYAGMTHSEMTLVAVLGRPDVAAAYGLTRRACDFVRVFIDMIGTATYGSFAHLVASNERNRSLTVHGQIASLRLSLAIAGAGVYIAVNPSLVAVWVGEDFNLGLLLTMLFALQMIVVGQGYLLNYLFRATGAVVAGSWMLLGESLLRIPLMVLAFHLAGIAGLPLAGCATAAVFGGWALSRTRRHLSISDRPVVPRRSMLMIARIAIVAAAAAIGGTVFLPSWPWVIGIAVAVLIGALLLLAACDEALRVTLSGVKSESLNLSGRMFS